jgi:DNA-binding IclR family transcriptional regulator
MYVGKVIPLSAGSASRVLLAWDSELAERVLSRELESLTEQTVTEAETMRELLAQTRSDGYAITTGERETGASGLSAPAWVDLLISHAEQITRTLGGRYPA